MRPEKPTEQAKCSCGEKTEWKWYEPEDPEDDEDIGEWWAHPCWRCNAIHLMKAELSMNAMGMEADGRLRPKQAERFIELVIDQASIAHTLHVTHFRWPFPWMKPWLWMTWAVWRWRRWRKGDSGKRFDVPVTMKSLFGSANPNYKKRPTE